MKEVEKRAADSHAAAVLAQKSAQSFERAMNLTKRREVNLEKQVSELKFSLADSQERLVSEVAWLRKSRTESVAAERKKVEAEIGEYRARIGRMQRHIMDTQAARDPLFMLNQATGTEECLEELIHEGINIPQAKMLKLKAGRSNWKAVVDQLEITDLLEGDLDVFPEFMEGAGVDVPEVTMEESDASDFSDY